MSTADPAARAVDLHVGTWLLGAGGDPVRRGAIAVSDGHVRYAGDVDTVRGALAGDAGVVREHEWSGVLAPGLVNAHSHLQYTCMAEVGQGRYAGFEEWSRAFGRLYAEPHEWAASTADGLERAIRTGTTAIADIVTDAEALTVELAARVHGISYWEVMGWLESRWLEEGREQTRAHLSRDSPRLGLSPHAPYSLDTEVVRDLGALADELGVRRHMHLAESAWEAEYVLHGAGDLADQWRRWGYGEFHLLRSGGARVRPVPYAESIGALGPDTHIAHGIYVDADDRAILRRTGTAVALCPRSNEVIGLAEAPVADYLREGNVISVGTDSLSSTPSLDLLGDVSALHRIARRQGYGDADLHARLLEAATLGGARALGMASGTDRIGTLTPGALADVVVLAVDGGTGADVLAAVVEDGEGSASATMVSGEVRWDRETSSAGRTSESSPSAAASTAS